MGSAGAGAAGHEGAAALSSAVSGLDAGSSSRGGNSSVAATATGRLPAGGASAPSSSSSSQEEAWAVPGRVSPVRVEDRRSSGAAGMASLGQGSPAVSRLRGLLPSPRRRSAGGGGGLGARRPSTPRSEVLQGLPSDAISSIVAQVEGEEEGGRYVNPVFSFNEAKHQRILEEARYLLAHAGGEQGLQLDIDPQDLCMRFGSKLDIQDVRAARNAVSGMAACPAAMPLPLAAARAAAPATPPTAAAVPHRVMLQAAGPVAAPPAAAAGGGQQAVGDPGIALQPVGLESVGTGTGSAASMGTGAAAPHPATASHATAGSGR